MQIRYLGSDKFEIRSTQVTMFLGDKVVVNDFILPGPGEYEKSGVSIVGIPNGDNVVYVFNLEDITLCHLGKLTSKLHQDEIKEMGDVDILFLPLGDQGTLSTKAALEVLSQIDPRIVVPMLYTDLTEFKKSEGLTDNELDVFKIKKADMPDEERQVAILKPSQTK